MEKFIIEFEGNHYDARYVEIDGYGKTVVSVESLNDTLLKDGDYVSQRAKEIDETICYFVPAEKMSYSDEDLACYVEMNIDENFVMKEFTQKRAKQINRNLIAEMSKADLIGDLDVFYSVDYLSRESWYQHIKPLFAECEKSVARHQLTADEYYDWLTEEVGLRLLEIDLLETKGVIHKPVVSVAA